MEIISDNNINILLDALQLIADYDYNSGNEGRNPRITYISGKASKALNDYMAKEKVPSKFREVTMSNSLFDKDCDCDDCEIYKDIKSSTQATYKHWIETKEAVKLDMEKIQKLFDQCKKGGSYEKN